MSFWLRSLPAELQDLYYLTGFYTIGDSAPQALVLPHDGEPFLVARLIECDLVPKLSWVSKVGDCALNLRCLTAFLSSLRSTRGHHFFVLHDLHVILPRGLLSQDAGLDMPRQSQRFRSLHVCHHSCKRTSALSSQQWCPCSSLCFLRMTLDELI